MEQSIMNKRFTLLAAGVAALFFSACGDNVVESYTPETPVIPEPAAIPPSTAVEATAKLNVIVQDGADKSLVTGAKVTLLSTGKAITSAAGVVLFDSVAVGQHGVRVELDGYASALAVGEIGSVVSDNIFQATNGFARVYLYPLTASLEGHLRYDNGSKKQLAPAGTEVRLVLTVSSDNSLENSQFTAVTGADGKYTFTDLPAVGSDLGYRIYAQTATVGGVTYPTQEVYNSTSTSRALLPGKPVSFGYADISENTSVFDVINYTDRITEATPVVIEFSDSIDVAKFSTNQITISPTLSFTAAVSTTDKTKLTLTPVGGKWIIDPVVNQNNTESFTVRINGLRSISGNSNNESKQVRLLAENSAFALVSVADKIIETGNVVFEFSDAIDATKFNTSLISVYDGSGYVLPFTVATPVGKTLTIKPRDGKWSFGQNYGSSNFYVNISSLTSVKGKEINGINRQIYVLSEADAFELVSKTDRISDDSPVVLTFSDVIDDTKFSTSLVRITPALNFDVEYSTDKTQLILKPRGGKWVIDPNIYQGQTYFTLSVGPLTSAKGKTTSTGSITVNLLAENSQFELLNFTNAISISDPVVFTFSDAIDIPRVANNTVNVSIGNNFDVTYSDDGKQLILTPKGGNWGTTNTSFSIDPFYLYSVKGVRYYVNSQNVSVAHKFKLVSNYASITYLESDTKIIEFEFSDDIDTDPTKFRRGSEASNSTVWAGSQADIEVSGKSIFVKPHVRWTSDFVVQFSNNINYALTSKNGEQVLGISNITFRLPVEDLNIKTVDNLAYADTIDQDGNNKDQFGNNKYAYFQNGWSGTQYFTLKFDEVPGAIGYYVYAKATTGTNKGAFVQLNDTYYYDVKTDSALVRVARPALTAANFGTVSEIFRNGGKVEFKVQAYNANTRTLLNGSESAEVFDKFGPMIANTGSYSRFEPIPSAELLATFSTYYTDHYNSTLGGYYYGYGASEIEGGYSSYSYYNLKDPTSGNISSNIRYLYGLNYYLSMDRTVDDTIAIHTQWFNEDLDVSTVTYAFVDNAGNPVDVGRIGVEISWLSPNNSNSYYGFNVVLKVNDGEATAAPVAANLVIGGPEGIKDKFGNPATIIYRNASNQQVVDNVLRFKITANSP
jgi:hypothetical protein